VSKIRFYLKQKSTIYVKIKDKLKPTLFISILALLIPNYVTDKDLYQHYGYFIK
jgi:hypothetical protein